MSRPAFTIPRPLVAVLQSVSAWWRAMPSRDRRLASLAIVAAGAALLWLLGVQPALRTAREAHAEIDRLDTELQQMQLLAAESLALRATPAVAPAQAATALKAATARLGDKARLVLQGERATITFVGVNGDALRGLLAEVRSTARARPVEAQLVRNPNGYDGTLTLGLGGTS